LIESGKRSTPPVKHPTPRCLGPRALQSLEKGVQELSCNRINRLFFKWLHPSCRPGTVDSQGRCDKFLCLYNLSFYKVFPRFGRPWGVVQQGPSNRAAVFAMREAMTFVEMDPHKTLVKTGFLYRIQGDRSSRQPWAGVAWSMPDVRRAFEYAHPPEQSNFGMWIANPWGLRRNMSRGRMRLRRKRPLGWAGGGSIQ